MSKCREEFEESGCKDYDTWRIAWNARGKVDKEICRYPGYIEDQEQYYGNLMAETIEQEDEK